MKNAIIGASMLAATLALPASAFAATYYYVNNDGQMQTVSADSSSEAMGMTTNMASGSSVSLDGDTLGRQIYQYVSTAGTIKVVVAANAAAALTTAMDIAAHSGVINVDTAGNAITTDKTVVNANAGAM